MFVCGRWFSTNENIYSMYIHFIYVFFSKLSHFLSLIILCNSGEFRRINRFVQNYQISLDLCRINKNLLETAKNKLDISFCTENKCSFSIALSFYFLPKFGSSLQEHFQNYIYFSLNWHMKTYPSSASTYIKITTTN